MKIALFLVGLAAAGAAYMTQEGPPFGPPGGGFPGGGGFPVAVRRKASGLRAAETWSWVCSDRMMFARS